MSDLDDDQDVRTLPDDELLAGEPLAGEPELTAFVSVLRASAEAEPPAPNAALAALLRDGLPPVASRATGTGTTLAAVPRGAEHEAATPRRAVAHRARRVGGAAGLALAAKIALWAGVAAASVTGAATIDGVPDAVQGPASSVVSGVVGLVTGGSVPEQREPAEPTDAEVVEPVSPADRGRSGETPGAGAPAPATDPSDDADKGVPEEAPTLPGSAAETARERAEEVREALEDGAVPAPEPRRPEPPQPGGPPMERPVDPPVDVDPGADGPTEGGVGSEHEKGAPVDEGTKGGDE